MSITIKVDNVVGTLPQEYGPLNPKGSFPEDFVRFVDESQKQSVWLIHKSFVPTEFVVDDMLDGESTDLLGIQLDGQGTFGEVPQMFAISDGYGKFVAVQAVIY